MLDRLSLSREIEYAAKFGFSPQKDFELTQYLLAPRGELAEPYKLTFGQDGKPLFVAGPYVFCPTTVLGWTRPYMVGAILALALQKLE